MQPLSGRTSTAPGQKGGSRDGSDRPAAWRTDRKTARAVRCLGQSATPHPHSRQCRRLPPGGTTPERHRRGKRAGRQGRSLPPGLTRWTSEAIVNSIEASGAKVVIPPKANRILQRLCDFALYCERNLVERFFNKIKHYRAIATRYAKRARNYMAFIALVSAVLWIK